MSRGTAIGLHHVRTQSGSRASRRNCRIPRSLGGIQGRDRSVYLATTVARYTAVLKNGRIVLGDRSSTIDCTVRSLNQRGAGLAVWNANDVPDNCALTIGSDQTRRNCRVTARTEKHIEIDLGYGLALRV